jgi:hypothetical protein
MFKIQKEAFKLKFHGEMKLYYRGSYEKHFLDYCFLNKISINSFDDQLYYTHNNRNHRYYPDFYHSKSNTIIEIKSRYTFDFGYEVNILKEKCAKEKYNFLFIIDKDYKEFNDIISTKIF